MAPLITQLIRGLSFGFSSPSEAFFHISASSLERRKNSSRVHSADRRPVIRLQQPLGASLSHFSVELVSPMPLLLLNNSFRTLASFQGKELELFLRYLVRFTSKEEGWNPDTKPVWWGNDLHFPRHFCSRNKEIPFAKNKLEKLRSIIRNCYVHYDSMELISLSERLAFKGPYRFKKNLNDTVTVYRLDKSVPLVVLPSSNVDYYAPVEHGALMNVYVKRRLQSAPVRRPVRKLLAVDLTTEEEEEGDCIALNPAQFSNKETPNLSSTFRAICRRELDMEPISEDDPNSENPCLPKRSSKRSFVDLTADGDDEYVAQCVFMNSLGIMSKREEPPIPPNPGALHFTRYEQKEGVPLKKLPLCNIPLLVRIGMIPKESLVTQDKIRRYTEFIDAHT